MTDHLTWRRIAAELRHLTSYTKRLRTVERKVSLPAADSERDGEA
jgi:hypothetical protein